MKRKVHASSLAKPMLLALVVLLFFAASQAQAKSLRSMPGKPALAVISITNLSPTLVKNRADLKARLLYLMAHEPKAIKVLSTGCCCAASVPLTSDVGFGTCVKDCMKDAGISAYSIIMCGAACALSETGAGLVLCAICVGLSTTVAETCALGCAARAEIPHVVEDAARNSRRGPTSSGSLQAKLRPQLAGAGPQ